MERFYSLDILRGIAALSVVFSHWKHFFYSGTILENFDKSKQPLFNWLYIFYTEGYLAVDLFFSLSGFIFYWLYSNRIAENHITSIHFLILRFSRLYPLHFVTLLLVACSQILLMDTQGYYFVYPNNDSIHFLLNLFFASSWGLQNGNSFNGPILSVSIEVLLYAIFFSCCRLLPVKMYVLVLLSIIGFIIKRYLSIPIGIGITSFFMGGFMFFIYQKIITSYHANKFTLFVFVLMILSWLATIIFIYSTDNISFHSENSISLYSSSNNLFNTAKKFLMRFQIWPICILFPLTILSLALIENFRGSLGKRFSFIGDISYSSYLIHFPLQLLIYIAATYLKFSTSVFYTSWFMISYFILLLLICYGSYRYFEMPAQKFLREYLNTYKKSYIFS